MQASRAKAKKAGFWSSFNQKIRSGRYGNLKLLGLAVGTFILCVVFLALKSPNASETPQINGEPLAVNLDRPSHTVQDEAVGNVENWSAGTEEHALSRDANAESVSAENITAEQKRLFKEMAEQLPPGAVIIF